MRTSSPSATARQEARQRNPPRVDAVSWPVSPSTREAIEKRMELLALAAAGDPDKAKMTLPPCLFENPDSLGCVVSIAQLRRYCPARADELLSWLSSRAQHPAIRDLARILTIEAL